MNLDQMFINSPDGTIEYQEKQLIQELKKEGLI